MLRVTLVALLMIGGAAMIQLSGGRAIESGDAARGQKAFQRCYACHSVEPDEGHLQGPNLFRILGRPAAALPGFEYSEAMRRKAAEGLVWDRTTLDAYIADPEAVVPGTLMSIPPVRDPQERADLIAYLSLSGQFKD